MLNLRRRCFGSRRRKIISIITALALILVSAAGAAWFVKTLTGTATGSFDTAQATLVVNPKPALNVPVSPSTDGKIGVSISNNTTISQTIATSDATITTVPGECAQHLTLQTLVGKVVPGGVSQDFALNLDAGPSTPATCSNGTIDVSFAGTTSP